MRHGTRAPLAAVYLVDMGCRAGPCRKAFNLGRPTSTTGCDMARRLEYNLLQHDAAHAAHHVAAGHLRATRSTLTGKHWRPSSASRASPTTRSTPSATGTSAQHAAKHSTAPHRTAPQRTAAQRSAAQTSNTAKPKTQRIEHSATHPNATNEQTNKRPTCVGQRAAPDRPVRRLTASIDSHSRTGR